METAYVIIYNCYGLAFKVVSESEKNEEIKNIIEMSKGEAGQDGRKLRFFTCVKKEDFLTEFCRMWG